MNHIETPEQWSETIGKIVAYAQSLGLEAEVVLDGCWDLESPKTSAEIEVRLHRNAQMPNRPTGQTWTTTKLPTQ